MIEASRLPSVQTVHGLCVSILPQTLQTSIFSMAVSKAAASGAISNSRFLMRNSAARRAERGPRPGSRASSWIRRSISGPAAAVGMKRRRSFSLLHALRRRRSGAHRLDQLTQTEQAALVLDSGSHLRHGGLEIGREAILVDDALMHQEAAGQDVTCQEARDCGRQRLCIDFFFHWPPSGLPPDLPAGQVNSEQLEPGRQRQAAGDGFHLLLQHRLGLAPRVAEGGNDEVLHDLLLLRLDQGVVDLDALHVALAGELDRDQTAAGGALDLDVV